MCVAAEVKINISHFYELILQRAEHKTSEIPNQDMQMLNHEPTAGPTEVSNWKLSEEMGWWCNLGPPVPPPQVCVEGETPPDPGSSGQFPICSTNGEQTPFLITPGKVVASPTLPTEPSSWNKWQPAIPGKRVRFLPVAISSWITN